MSSYRAITGQESISTATIQTALDGLRDKNLIWRESCGAYALEDQGFAEWFKHRRLKPSSL
jgi:hypothetical protein